jgi:hypothetical protein
MKSQSYKKIFAVIVVIFIIDSFVVRYGQGLRKEVELKYAQIIEEKIDRNTNKTISLSRTMGGWGLTLNAKLKLEKEKISLIKGYTEGSTGANITIGGNPIGFGVSSPNFWLEENSINGHSVYDVRVNFKRVRFLIFNESVTMLVGRYTPKYISTKSKTQSQIVSTNKSIK